ncbi:hypothetical protein BDQ17DRAFT_519116 [Cyathus striatus]|nr:hypothetical protein BDQ17DRAFT_519116 [Cyathus striatus]
MAVLCNEPCVDDVVLNFLNVTSEVNSTFRHSKHIFRPFYDALLSGYPPSSRNGSRRPRHANSTTWSIKLSQALKVFFRMLNTSRCSRWRLQRGRGSLRMTSLGRLVLLRGTICEDQTVSGLAGLEKTLTALRMRQLIPNVPSLSSKIYSALSTVADYVATMTLPN